LEQTTRNYKDTIKKILQKPDIKNIQILISDPSPKSPLISKIRNLVGTNINTLTGSLESLNELKQDTELSEKQREKLHIKITEEIPIQSMFILDGKEDSAIVRFEPYLFGITKELRPIHELSKRKEKKDF